MTLDVPTFKPGDRVRFDADKVAGTVWSNATWRGRIGTVTGIGAVNGAVCRPSSWSKQGRVYVIWDGNRSFTCESAGMLMLAALEFGVEPATTG